MAAVKKCLLGSHLLYRQLNAVGPKTILQANCRHRLNSYRSIASARTVAKRKLSKGWVLVAAGISGVATGWVMRNVMVSASEPTGIPPPIQPSRSVKFPSDTTGLKLTLYQYQTCPFCCKVRAFLNFHGISYDIVEVNPVLRSQIKFSKWKKVPILVIEDEKGIQQLNDSSMIISCLQSYLMDSAHPLSTLASYYPPLSYINEKGETITEIVNRYNLMFGNQPADKSREEQELERKWRQWADGVLVHTLSPNIYGTPREAMDAFQWFSEVGEWEKHFPAWERYIVLYVGSTAMYFVGKRLKKRHHLKDDVRQSLYEAGQEWTKALGQKPFMGGGKPNLADLAVFGVLNAIEGCASFQDLKANTDIYEWYSRMKHEVASHHAGS